MKTSSARHRKGSGGVVTGRQSATHTHTHTLWRRGDALRCIWAKRRHTPRTASPYKPRRGPSRSRPGWCLTFPCHVLIGRDCPIFERLLRGRALATPTPDVPGRDHIADPVYTAARLPPSAVRLRRRPVSRETRVRDGTPAPRLVCGILSPLGRRTR